MAFHPTGHYPFPFRISPFPLVISSSYIILFQAASISVAGTDLAASVSISTNHLILLLLSFQAASISVAGADLAASLSISTKDLVLFATFSKARSEPKQDIPDDSSAVCIFPLKNIQTTFTDNIKKCFKGEGFQV